MNIVEAQGLRKMYRKKTVLEDLSFSIEDHTITGLIGRNGAGKTTLLKLLAGFNRPDGGRLTVFSEQPFNNLAVSADMIFIEDHMNWPSLQLGELLQEGKRFYKNWDDTLPERLFDYFNLNKGQFHKSLSKGKKSTFNLIFGLAARCPLTLLDEPMTGMDAAVRQDMYRVLLKEYLAWPRTILLSSHHMEEVEHLLEDVLLLDEGQKQLHLSMDALREKVIGLSGPLPVLQRWTQGQRVLHRTFVATEEYMVVEHNFSEEEQKQMKQAGITLSSVTPTNAAVYLTSKTERSIDDVLERN